MENHPAVGHMSEVHRDERRIIYEFNSDKFSVQKIKVLERIPLGNHYHVTKTETFVLVIGSGIVKCCPVDSHGLPIAGRMEERELSEGAVIHVPEMMAHAFLLEPGSVMIFYSSKPFDPSP